MLQHKLNSSDMFTGLDRFSYLTGIGNLKQNDLSLIYKYNCFEYKLRLKVAKTPICYLMNQ